jgi:glycerate dehydrogenase
MKIVVLDGYTLNPGDLTWAALETLGEVTVYDRSSADQVVERAQDAEIMLVNKAQISRETMDRLPKLRHITVLATGYDIVDGTAAREKGISVSNIPTYGTASVAQMTFAHLLNLTQHVAEHAQTVRDGDWTRSADWCYWNFPLVELEGLTMGVLGFGRIGQNVGQVAQAFRMKVLAYDAFIKESPLPGAQMVDMETVFRESDVISLHLPLTPETRGMVNAARLATMKPTAFIINTSRGQVINNADLAEALNTGVIAGAGLDVLEVEPPSADNPLLTAKNCYITPHISRATRSARARLMQIAVDNVCAFLDGKPINVVN